MPEVRCLKLDSVEPQKTSAAERKKTANTPEALQNGCVHRGALFAEGDQNNALRNLPHSFGSIPPQSLLSYIWRSKFVAATLLHLAALHRVS